MRVFIRLSGLVASCSVFVPSIFAQTNPPPSDPHELVVHQPRTLSSPAERSAAIDLLEHAREDLNMHAFGAYELLPVLHSSVHWDLGAQGKTFTEEAGSRRGLKILLQ
jgi:hypothetical protein